MKHSLRTGSIALVSLLAMALLLTISLGLTGLAMQNVKRSGRDTNANLALQVAQAGLELQVSRCFGSMGTNLGLFISGTTDVSADLSGITNGVNATTWVTAFDSGRQAWVSCTATVRGMTRRVRTRVTSRNIGIWNNAIFAGTGAAGQTINGNVDIRGSVHLLGEGEKYSDLNGNGQWDGAEGYADKNHNGVWDPGEPFSDTNGDGVWSAGEPYNDSNHNLTYDDPFTATDLNSTFSGNAYVGNNYSGMPAGLESLVPTLTQINGVESLEAEFRCKHGKISLSGSATLGYGSAIDGGTSKATLDGVYVSDGFAGTQGASAVFSDNGTSDGYDLDGYGLEFPLITGLGSVPYVDKQGITWNSYCDFYNAKSLTVPVATIVSSTAAFSYGPDAYGNRVTFNPQKTVSGVTTPATLHVEGVIKFVGDLQIGAKDVIRYTGDGTLYSAGTIKIDGDFLPLSGYTFPTTTRMGVVAKQDLKLATGNGSSQLTMAGAFYAQGSIISRKQNQIAGTFVASYYDMGTNVPNIYQVPSLPNNMPPAMPGDTNIYAVRTRTWRERH